MSGQRASARRTIVVALIVLAVAALVLRLDHPHPVAHRHVSPGVVTT